MNYDRAQFFRLLDVVEQQGGTLLDKIHEHSVYDKFCGGPPRDVQFGYMKNCGESALFEIPYLSYVDGEPHSVEICAKDDMMGLWPRFAAANAIGEV